MEITNVSFNVSRDLITINFIDHENRDQSWVINQVKIVLDEEDWFIEAAPIEGHYAILLNHNKYYGESTVGDDLNNIPIMNSMIALADSAWGRFIEHVAQLLTTE